MHRPNAKYFTAQDKQNVASLILDYLKLEGVNHIFGIPGGGLKQLLEELRVREDEFSYIICRQESGAAYMADGYFRASGKLGVVMVTSGPGATNALTGSMNAEADHSAVLVITGEVPQEYIGMGYLQGGIGGSLRTNSVYRAAVQYSQVIDNADELHTLITQALRDSLGLPRRATHLSLPNNVGTATPSQPIPFPTTTANYRSMSLPQDPVRVKAAFDLLLAAKRPIIFLGNGNRFVLRDENRLTRFGQLVDKFAIPVMTTPDGKAVFPESHSMSLRCYGIAACEWPMLYMKDKSENYDALMVIGSSLGELATMVAGPFNPLLIPDGPFIQINADATAIARSFPVELGIVSDAGLAIDTLCDLGESVSVDDLHGVTERRAYIAHLKKSHSPYFHPEKRESTAVPILPQTMSRILQEALPTETECHIFVDGGNCIGWALHYMKIDPPVQMHNALDIGPMGWGTCAVVGAKFAHPNSMCITVTGDGGFMMQGSEVSTAAQHKLGVIWIVEFNNDLAMVSQGMANFYPPPKYPKDPSWKDYYSIGNPDLEKYAEGLGADAYQASTAEEFQDVLARAIEGSMRNKPQVVVVNIDRNEIPPYYQPIPTDVSA